MYTNWYTQLPWMRPRTNTPSSRRLEKTRKATLNGAEIFSKKRERKKLEIRSPFPLEFWWRYPLSISSLCCHLIILTTSHPSATHRHTSRHSCGALHIHTKFSSILHQHFSAIPRLGSSRKLCVRLQNIHASFGQTMVFFPSHTTGNNKLFSPTRIRLNTCTHHYIVTQQNMLTYFVGILKKYQQKMWKKNRDINPQW